MKMKFIYRCLLGISLVPGLAQAQLAVTVLPPKVVGEKAVVELTMTNSFPQEIQSARAVCFLLDEQGKMAGQSTKWVVGGIKNQPVLESKAETKFNFVITASQPFATTNLTAKVSFSRVVLADGTPINIAKDVAVTMAQ
jgi:hypothetical protein